MKKLTAEEFQDRLQAINRAMKIFGELSGNDISKAFAAYQAVLAETERPLSLPSSAFKGMTGSEFDAYDRPECPDCGSEMGIRSVPVNDAGVKTQLVCFNTECDTVLDSELTMEGWKGVLSKR